MKYLSILFFAILALISVRSSYAYTKNVTVTNWNTSTASFNYSISIDSQEYQYMLNTCPNMDYYFVLLRSFNGSNEAIPSYQEGETVTGAGTYTGTLSLEYDQWVNGLRLSIAGRQDESTQCDGLYGDDNNQNIIYDFPYNFSGTFGGGGGGGGGIPQANQQVLGATTDTISGFQDALTSNLAINIPIYAVVLISIAVVYFVIRRFKYLRQIDIMSVDNLANYTYDKEGHPHYSKWKAIKNQITTII